LWGGLVLALSRSSLGALLVGLGVLAALRWKPTRALVAAVVVVALGAAAVAWSAAALGCSAIVRCGATAQARSSPNTALTTQRPTPRWPPRTRSRSRSPPNRD